MAGKRRGESESEEKNEVGKASRHPETLGENVKSVKSGDGLL
jgi:hypothetical protein